MGSGVLQRVGHVDTVEVADFGIVLGNLRELLFLRLGRVGAALAMQHQVLRDDVDGHRERLRDYGARATAHERRDVYVVGE